MVAVVGAVGGLAILLVYMYYMFATRTRGRFALGSPNKGLRAAVAVNSRLACSVAYSKQRVLTPSPVTVSLSGKRM